MKTYQQFLEVTAADIRAMGGNEKQMKILRDRQKARGGTGMGQKGSTGSHMHQKQDKKGSSVPSRPADKGAAIVRQKQGGTGKEAVGAPKISGPGTRPNRGQITRSPGGALAKIDRSRPDEKQAGSRPGTTRGQNVPSTGKPTTKPKNQFVSGFKSAMGGDAFAKNDSATRRKARNELGKKTANVIKSVPGKVAGKLRNGGTPGRVKSATAPSMGGGAFTSKFSR